MAGPADRDLADRALSLPAPVIGCRRIEMSHTHVTVRCLAVISTATLLRLANRRAGSVRLISASCDGCPDARGRLLALDHSIAAFRELRLELGLPDLCVVEEDRTLVSREERSRFARRELLTRFLPRLEDAGPGAAEEARAEIASSCGSAAAAPLTHCPLGRPRVGASCDGCGACARLCPTGALEASKNGSFRLELRHDRCAACETCVAVCDRAAVRVERVLSRSSGAAKETLAEIAGATCSECAAPVAEGEGTCVACRRRYAMGSRPS
ncbi:MAG: 4Fe-4S dicluster domain-containing protein [Planctomycetota bacterium]